MKVILQEEEDLSEIVQQLLLLCFCVSTVFEFSVLQLSLLQVKEILQEEEDLSEIVQQLFLRLLFFS